MTFQRSADRQDRRRFERHDTTWDAVATFEDGTTLLCVLRNYTVAGAFIEFADEPPPAGRFRLALNRFDFQAGCEVRRRFGKAVGVTFFDAVPSQLVAVNAAAQRGEGWQSAAVADERRQARQAPLDQLSTMLDELIEFRACGFKTRPDRGGRSLQIMRGLSVRGSWLTAPAGLQWRPASGSGALEVGTAADAARATMLMVLNSVILRRTALPVAGDASNPVPTRAALTRP